MVKYIESNVEKKLDFIFASLSDPTRRRILRRVAQRPLTVSEIARPYSISLPAVSKHLKILERAELIKRSKRGRKHIVQLNPDSLQTAEQYIVKYKKFWEYKLDSLQNYLEGGDE
ncbi:MAG: metalloregulator ArsR/SmtB family transcription factor [Candidatus Andersenbacteria bacterium]